MKNYKKEYENKLFSIIGDSVSTFEGVTPENYEVFYTAPMKCTTNVLAAEDTWWGKVIKALGGELLVNDSWSGSLVTKHPKCEIESYGASDARTSNLGKDGKTPDVVMIYIGTNDWGWNVPVDPQAGQENDISVFKVAYDTMIKKIKKNYPQAEIWCFTLAISDGMEDCGNVHPYVRSGRALREYCCAIRESATENNCRLIELYCPEEQYETVDKYHPNRRGMQTLAKIVLDQLTESDE